MTSFYVYAIVPSSGKPPADLNGLHDEPLRLVHYHDLAAVVGDSPSEISVTEERVTAHHSVVTGLRRTTPAIPVRFGTVVADEHALRGSLERQYDVLLEDIARLDGTVEYGVTVLWGTRLESVELPAPPEVRQSVSGAEYMSLRLAEHQRGAELRRIAGDVQTEINRALTPFALESRDTVLPSPGIPLRASFLVRERYSEQFTQAFRGARQRNHDLRMLLVGPWPPYSFVTPDSGIHAGTHGANSE